MKFRPFDCAIGLFLSLVCLLPLGIGCRKPPTLKSAGGYILTYEVDTEDRDEIRETVESLINRLDPDGYNGYSVKAKPAGLIEIELPGVDAELLEIIKEGISIKGELEFLILANKSDEEDYAIPGQTPQDEIGNRDKTKWVSYDPEEFSYIPTLITRGHPSGRQEVLVIVDELTITGQDFESVTTDTDENGGPAIRGTLTKEGAKKMRILTSENLPDKVNGRYTHLGVVLDGELITAPRLMSTISERLQLTGNFIDEDVIGIVDLIYFGRHPVKVKDEPFSEKRIEAGK